MKNCLCLANVCLLILFASATLLAQQVTASLRPPAGNPHQTCPLVTVSCLSDVEVGKPIEFKVTIENPTPNTVPTYKWEVVGGVLAEGQGTPAIRVNRFKYQAVTATLHIGGLDPVCANTASCTMPIHHPFPPPQKFDSYGALPTHKQQARLALFAAALKNQPGSQAYIFGYDGPPSQGSESQKSFVEFARAYLIDKLGIDLSRVVTVDAGFKGQLTIDLYLVPIASIPPVSEPTVEPCGVQPMKATAHPNPKRSKP